MLKRMLDHSRRVALMCAAALGALMAYVYFDKPHLWTFGNLALATAGILALGIFIVVYEEFVARPIYAKARARQNKT